MQQLQISHFFVFVGCLHSHCIFNLQKAILGATKLKKHNEVSKQSLKLGTVDS